MTETLFAIVVALVAGQRLAELSLSRQNERFLRSKGAIEHAPGQMAWMRAIHAGWLVSMLLEVFVLDRPVHPPLVVVGVIGVVAGQLFRYSAIWTLGPRWSVRILTLPGRPPVTRGIYRYVRHPNYVGVVLEIAMLPLLHSAYLTAIAFTMANAWLLRVRVRAEDAALAAEGGYGEALRGR